MTLDKSDQDTSLNVREGVQIPQRRMRCQQWCIMTTVEASGLWLVEIFLLQIWHIWAFLRPFYRWSFFDSGIISKKNLQKPILGPVGTVDASIVNYFMTIKYHIIKTNEVPNNTAARSCNSTVKTQNSRRMIWNYGKLAENGSAVCPHSILPIYPSNLANLGRISY